MSAKRLISTLLYACVFTSGFQLTGHVTDSIRNSVQVNKLFDCTTDKSFPGASVIVIHNGNILLSKGYGFADIEQGEPNTPHTVFRLGSMTKQFTAMAILKLYDKQMLQINDNIEKYFPGTMNGNKITIKHLLTHTSGITESLNTELAFIPGTQINYSNTGYNLLGKIIEKVSGMSYEKYLQENIFSPLEMEHTGYEHPDIQVKSKAAGYKINENGVYTNTGESDVSRTFAAGALYSTIEDLYKWDQALYTEKLIKASLLEQAFDQAILNDGTPVRYGYGWMVNQWRGLKEVGHGGDVTGFNSYIARYPDEKCTVIVLSNIEMRPPGPIPDARVLAHNIAEIYLSDKITATKERVPVRLDPKILDKYSGQYKWVDASRGWLEASGDYFTISRRTNQLFIKSKAGEIELFAEAEDSFFIKDNSTIKFTKDDDNVIRMELDAMDLGVVIVKAQKLNP